jgi:hypothetical protein
LEADRHSMSKSMPLSSLSPATTTENQMGFGSPAPDGLAADSGAKRNDREQVVSVGLLNELT